MLRVRVDLDVGRDRRLLSQAVAEDVLAWIGFGKVAIRQDVDAGSADGEDRDLEAYRQGMHGDRRDGKRAPAEGEQLSPLDEGLSYMRRRQPARPVLSVDQSDP